MGIYTDDDVYYGFQAPMASILPAGTTADDYEGRALGEAIAFRLCEMADADPALAAAFASEHRPRKILVEYDGGVRFVYEQSPIKHRAEDGKAVAIRPTPSDAQRANALAIATAMLIPAHRVGVWAISTVWTSHDPELYPYCSVAGVKRLSSS
ncbi:hypothetical protein [Medusavirus stheno T3]|uniref:Uncharacterized protein n=1 Tax=Medusavirus stheno T3 TaxID=3069717 RepID=A0A7S7YEJ6_9VIRU|nr:hypothetical protein QKU73_gp155 [Acanthamoeba castellanii medusavirus]QPB44336.1 hypothetical protein [Medusavirus stheno T3]